jgi:hypothetical protein
MGWDRGGNAYLIVRQVVIMVVIGDVTPVIFIIIFILGTLRRYKKCKIHLNIYLLYI